jgi:hypothetical protein
MSKRTTLAEIMGSTAADRGANGLSLDQLPMILGEAMPELPRNGIGRHRLIRALQQRFGANFRSLPGISDLVSQFDKDVALEQKIDMMKAIKPKKGS